MKLEHIPVPAWSPPRCGPWRIRWTRPDGESGTTACTWDVHAEAQAMANVANRVCREGCTYDVVPAGDPS
jgi:hypothetical protein